MKQSILLATHHTGTPGMYDKLKSYFAEHNWYVSSVIHPLYPKLGALSSIQVQKKTFHYTVPARLQYLLEGVVAAYHWKRLGVTKTHDVALCFDTLSFWNVFLFRWVYGVNRIVFYSLDFSQQRFGSPIMNTIYTTLTTAAYRWCDSFLTPTETMINAIDPLQRHSFKAQCVPHTVDTTRRKNFRRVKNSFVFAGTLSETVLFEPLLQAFSTVTKRYPKISCTLDIYGDGRKKHAIEQLVVKYRLAGIVKFHGVVSNTELLTEILPRYEYGVAPYALPGDVEAPDHMFHGTALTSKIIEYFAAGLPVLSTRIYSAFDSIDRESLGFLCNTLQDWETVLTKILESKSDLTGLRRNVYRYVKQFDVDRVWSRVIEEIKKQ